MPKVNLKISSLLLDHYNPRIPQAESQREALQRIIDEQEEKLAALAQSIVDDGLSPADNFLVMRSPDDERKFIVLEGNRRLAALKLLNNINVVADLRVGNGLKKRFEKAAREFKAETVEPLSCFELSREDANPWIQRRHTGEDSGRGIVNWNAQAAARFRGEDPALQVLKFVLDHGNLTSEQEGLLSGRFITTLRRLLESPAVRAELGLDLKKQKLSSCLPVEELIKPLKRIVLDLAEKHITVTQLKTKPQMTTYVPKRWTSSARRRPHQQTIARGHKQNQRCGRHRVNAHALHRSVFGWCPNLTSSTSPISEHLKSTKSSKR